MTDSEFQAKYILLKRLAWLALVGVVPVCIAVALSDDRVKPFGGFALLGAGALCIVPALVYLVILTLWHWKGRYQGQHSNLWGAVLVLETSGWGKLIYLFRHIIPDARKSGRYAASTPGSGT